MEITIAELQQAVSLAFEHLKSLGMDSVSIPYDFYWHIPKDQMYDNYHQPKNLTVGQLSDDLREIRKIITGQSAPDATMYIWLAMILRAVGDSHLN